jgi:hypothetical protein
VSGWLIRDLRFPLFRERLLSDSSPGAKQTRSAVSEVRQGKGQENEALMHRFMGRVATKYRVW